MHLDVEQASTDFGLFWVFVGAGNFCTVNLFGELSDVLGRKVQYVSDSNANLCEQLLYYVSLVCVCIGTSDTKPAFILPLIRSLLS